eukprot:9024691-Alexandrium_andersonii.AAC.1
MSTNPSDPTETTRSPRATPFTLCDPATSPQPTLPRSRTTPAWPDSTSSSFTLTPSATPTGGANTARAALSHLAASSASRG